MMSDVIMAILGVTRGDGASFIAWISIEFINKRFYLLMDQRITIAELTPASRGAHLLRFEVAEVEPISSKPD